MILRSVSNDQLLRSVVIEPTPSNSIQRAPSRGWISGASGWPYRRFHVLANFWGTPGHPSGPLDGRVLKEGSTPSHAYQFLRDLVHLCHFIRATVSWINVLLILIELEQATDFTWGSKPAQNRPFSCA
jgi:hypothetical protein